MNYLVAIVLLITIPGTFASIRRGQADANTITPYESALRQLKAAGGVGGMGVVMGMKGVTTPAPTIAPTLVPTSVPTLVPTSVPTPIPTLVPTPRPTIYITEFNLGTVSFTTSGSTYSAGLLRDVMEDSYLGIFDEFLPFFNDAFATSTSMTRPTPTDANPTSQVTVYSIDNFVYTSELLMNVGGLDYDAYVREVTGEMIDIFVTAFNNEDFQKKLFETLSSIGETEIFVISVLVSPSGIPPQ